jgi:hypothetical protein
MLRKHAGFALLSEGRMVRRPCERLRGHGIQKGDSPSQEKGLSPFCMSEALNRAAFASLGQKRRADEPFRLSYSNGFRTIQPSLSAELENAF